MDDAQTLSKVWWRGTLNGAVKGLLVGAFVGLLASVVLQFAIIPLVTSVGYGFAVQGLSGFLAPGGSFFPLSMMLFSGASTMIGGFLNGGTTALKERNSQSRQQFQEAKIQELEGREQTLEQAITTRPNIAQTILAQGPRHQHSFVAAEEARATTHESPTLH